MFPRLHRLQRPRLLHRPRPRRLQPQQRLNSLRSLLPGSELSSSQFFCQVFWIFFDWFLPFSRHFSSKVIYFVFDPSQGLYYKWLTIISIAILYNFIFIIGRASFELLQLYNPLLWIVLDYSCDLIYLLDIFVRLRTG